MSGDFGVYKYIGLYYNLISAKLVFTACFAILQFIPGDLDLLDNVMRKEGRILRIAHTGNVYLIGSYLFEDFDPSQVRRVIIQCDNVWMPDKPKAQTYDQLIHLKRQLLFSKHSQEPISYGYITEIFNLSKKPDTLIDRFYFTNYGVYRVIEIITDKHNRAYRVERWGDLPNNTASCFIGSSIKKKIEKNNGEERLVLSYKGGESVKVFGPFYHSIFLNSSVVKPTTDSPSRQLTLELIEA